MFSAVALQYWSLYCHVGGASNGASGKLYGLGCRVGRNFVLTAAHVYEKHEYPTVLLTDGLWRCKVAEEWTDLDIGLLRVIEPIERRSNSEEPTNYPALATVTPTLGTSLGYIGWLRTLDETGKSTGRTYFGQGHVAFFSKGLRDQILIAIDGSAVEQGFSGGPVFTTEGALSAVLVQAMQYAPNLSHPVRQIDSLPLASPIAPIRDALVARLHQA